MLERTSTTVSVGAPPVTEPFFYSIRLFREPTGRFFVEVTATHPDEENQSLLQEDIANQEFTSIDEALLLVKEEIIRRIPRRKTS